MQRLLHLLLYLRDPRFRTERILAFVMFPLALVALGGVAWLVSLQLRMDEAATRPVVTAATEPTPTPTPTPETAFQKGKKAFVAKDYAVAKTELELALSSPDSTEAASLLGILANLDKDFESAIRYFTQAIAARPEARFYFNRSGAWRRAGRLPEALADMRSAVQLEPGNPLFSNKLGILRIANGETAAVAEEMKLKNAVELVNARQGWIVIEALLAMKESRYSEATVCLEIAVQSLPQAVSTSLLQDPELLAYQNEPELLRFYFINR